MLLVTDLKGNIVAAWTGNNQNLKSIYPHNPNIETQYKEYHFQEDDVNVLGNPVKYKIVDGVPVLKSFSIDDQYQQVLDNLIRQKQDKEMMGEP